MIDFDAMLPPPMERWGRQEWDTHRQLVLEICAERMVIYFQACEAEQAALAEILRPLARKPGAA